MQVCFEAAILNFEKRGHLVRGLTPRNLRKPLVALGFSENFRTFWSPQNTVSDPSKYFWLMIRMQLITIDIGLKYFILHFIEHFFTNIADREDEDFQLESEGEESNEEEEELLNEEATLFDESKLYLVEYFHKIQTTKIC